MLETSPDVDFVFSELREEMSAAHVRVLERLIALGIPVTSRITDELEAEAHELREWVDRVRAVVARDNGREASFTAPNRYTPENPPDRP